MKDPELLQLAAKAAGYRIEPRSDGAYAIECNGGWWPWNPLNADGDALRLAVRLRLWVRWREDSEVNVCWYDERGIFAGNFTEHGDDLDAATRRAIVRAAAEIGRSTE